ncbi:hypothetical protein [Antrihabitans sp. YC2-6]|uniref:hypothetical protein n=1 Tax=Antrihabitans sp. YC2-6 TaxID=2799498 RepID=UPI0018F457EF|nr:hypothetical protein [Antrihabitans sp. YC2-6]MBJ8345214.1 hypothetical protein [Antrihabitans sp. YC2-6]
MADPQAVAEKLLDALVEFVLAEVTDRFDEVVVREIDLVLEGADTIVIGDVVDPADVKLTARMGVDHVGGSELIGELVIPFVETFYNLDAAEDYDLGEVIEREHFQALVAALLRMNTAQDRIFERLTLSPLVAQLASSFVGKIVGDFVAENRKKAERVPGMSSLFSVGDRVASTAAKVGKGQLDALSGKGAQYALKQTENAVRDLIKEAPVEEAALEVWDLHAGERVSELRKYVSEDEARELADLGHGLAMSVRQKEYTLSLVDAWIDTFFATSGKLTVRQLLEKIGLTRDDLVTEGSRLAPPIIEALIANGVLAAQIRQRLEPFFLSESTLAIIADE